MLPDFKAKLSLNLGLPTSHNHLKGQNMLTSQQRNPTHTHTVQKAFVVSTATFVVLPMLFFCPLSLFSFPYRFIHACKSWNNQRPTLTVYRNWHIVVKDGICHRLIVQSVQNIPVPVIIIIAGLPLEENTSDTYYWRKHWKFKCITILCIWVFFILISIKYAWQP